MTFEQAFFKVKEKFDNADASNTADFAVQITFTDSDCGGTFYAEVKEGNLAVEPYNYYDNNAALNITKSALLAYIAGRTTLDKAIANGDAYVEGDASKIADWKATIKKTAAKKAPTKKTTAAKKTTKKSAAKKETKATVKKDTAKSTAKTATKKNTKAAVKTETKTTATASAAKSTLKK